MQSKLTLFLFTLSTFSALPIISTAHQNDIALMPQPRTGKAFIARTIAREIAKQKSKPLRNEALKIGYSLIGISFLGLITNYYRSSTPFKIGNRLFYKKLMPKKAIIGLAVTGSGIAGATHLFTTSENFVDKTIGWNVYNRISQFHKRYIKGESSHENP